MIYSDRKVKLPLMSDFNQISGCSTKLSILEQLNYTGHTSALNIFFMPGGLTPTDKRKPLENSFLKNYIQADANDFYLFFGGDGSLNKEPKSGLFFHCSRFISPLFSSGVLEVTLVIYPVFIWGGIDLNDFLADLSSKRLGHYLADIVRKSNVPMDVEFDLVYLKKDIFISNSHHVIIENGIRNGIRF